MSTRLLILFGSLVIYVAVAFLALAYGDLGLARFVLFLNLIINIPYLIYTYISSRRLYRDQNSWEKQYFESAYVLIFSSSIAEGTSTVEKVLNLAKMIFPELLVESKSQKAFRKIFKKKSREQISSNNLNYKISPSYQVDLVLKTSNGYFIVNDFGDTKVSLEHLLELKQNIEHMFRDKYLRPNVLRVICVAKSYDEELMNEESMAKIMKENLKPKVKIDLIIQDKFGFSVLWVS